jgi:hypothetical protein
MVHKQASDSVRVPIHTPTTPQVSDGLMDCLLQQCPGLQSLSLASCPGVSDLTLNSICSERTPGPGVPHVACFPSQLIIDTQRSQIRAYVSHYYLFIHTDLFTYDLRIKFIDERFFCNSFLLLPRLSYKYKVKDSQQRFIQISTGLHFPCQKSPLNLDY